VILDALTRSAGSPVSPDRLAAELWRADCFLSEDALDEAVRRLAHRLAATATVLVILPGPRYLLRREPP
jgi:DNA-binding response OmpR family regulator